MHHPQIPIISVFGFAACLVGCQSSSSNKVRDAAVADNTAEAGTVTDAPGVRTEVADDGLSETNVDGTLGGDMGSVFDGLASMQANPAAVDAPVLDGAQEDLGTFDVPSPAPSKTVAVRAVPEPWGSNCPRGGVKIETGTDLDGNGALDTYEVTQEQYVCNVYPKAVSLGPHHTCGLASSGAVWCWGADDVGQLGDYGAFAAYAPRPVEGVPAALALAVGGDFGCVILPTKGARCWGKNDRGQGGHGVDRPFISPSCVTGSDGSTSLLGVTSLSAGGVHACLALDDGSVNCWGANEVGQLGDGTSVDSNKVVQVVGIRGVQSVAAGRSHACALLKDTTVRCWGANDEGQLGDGTTAARFGVVTVGDIAAPLSGVTALAAGDAFTCAVMQDATVLCWGANAGCQLGQPATISRALLPAATPLSDVQSIAAGAEHACAILNSGKAVCWGRNDFGQVGAPAGACREKAVELPLAGVVSVGVGSTHSCAVDQTGLWCWGDDSQGQLGVGIASAARSTHEPQLAVWHLAP